MMETFKYKDYKFKRENSKRDDGGIEYENQR